MSAFLGVDIGTSSSKGVLLSESGELLAQAQLAHRVDRPAVGQVEMDAESWWREFTRITGELLATADVPIRAVGVSGMGPCVVVADADDVPLRPAILYGVDTRAQRQIERLTAELGADQIMQRGGSALSTQAVGPKLAWLAENEPQVMAAARRLYMPSSLLVRRLTGRYVLDHHSASQCTPLYDSAALSWYPPWWERICPRLEPPELLWSGEIAGVVTAEAARLTGLAAGTPVIAGTIDAWAEAASVDAVHPGDLMLMYGTTMFLVNTVAAQLSSPTLWATVGVLPGSRSLAGGMATSGAITGWLSDLFGDADYAELTAAAGAVPPGANGLLMLPYFAGERTPIADPDARGVIAGLTLSHGRGELYRAALEATAFGIRHNLETFDEAGGRIERITAVGGGTQGSLWTQIVSDVTGREQQLRKHSIGASFGIGYLAAAAVDPEVDITEWNPPAGSVQPDPATTEIYDRLYRHYRELYRNTRDVVHELAALQRKSRSVAGPGAPPG